MPESPALLAAVTYGWLALLVASPLLVAAAGRVRAALAGILVAAHLSMAFTLQIGVFPVVSATALLPFCPPFVWDRIESLAAPEIGRFRSMAERLLRSLRSTRPGSTLVDLASKIVPDRATRERLVAVIAALLLVSLLAWTAMGSESSTRQSPSWRCQIRPRATGICSRRSRRRPTRSCSRRRRPPTATGPMRCTATRSRPTAPRPTRGDIPPPAGGSTSLLSADDTDRIDATLAHLCDRAAGFSGAETEAVTVSAVEVDVVGSEEGRSEKPVRVSAGEKERASMVNASDRSRLTISQSPVRPRSTSRSRSRSPRRVCSRRTFVWGGRRYRWRSLFDVEVLTV